MEFRAYFTGMTPEDQQAFADRAGTTAKYIYTHFMANPPRRTPRPKLMNDLIAATQGIVSREEMLDHFYPKVDIEKAG